MIEGQQLDKKSLKTVIGQSADFDELAKDCVAFANAYGGKLLIGIEDNDELPPAKQKVSKDLPGRIQKRISELTINVSVIPQVITAPNGGEYIELTVQRSASTIASTTSAAYFIRIDDQSKRLYPDELQRLLTDKGAFTWETKVVLGTNWNEADEGKLREFLNDIRSSQRVSNFIKEKSTVETLEYYNFVDTKGTLTNLGVLWIGRREHRARLLFAPVIQFIKYDAQERKVNKKVWDDFSLNPKEMIEAVWSEIPDWQESFEISDGIFRKNIPAYDEVVIRELIANALAHRPYTTRGDIFINLYPERLEVVNPGVFPLGVTPENILHKSVRRNEHLCKVFYDLQLMEREGSGYDKMFEKLLSLGKPIPVPTEGDDFVKVNINRQIISQEAVKVMDRAQQHFNLRSKEIICLGLLAQHESLTAIELTQMLGLKEKDALRSWLGQLPELELVQSVGKTKGTSYFVNPDLLRLSDFKGKTSLKKIEPYRIKELIKEDLIRYKKATISEIEDRIGKEIPRRKIRAQIEELEKEGFLIKEANHRWTQYSLCKK